MKLIFATHNYNKSKEVASILPKFIELSNLADIGYTEDIAETAATIEGNALIKARTIYQKTNCSCFSDDSGLFVEALNGLPGVRSARYAGEQKSDADNIQKLLNELSDKPNRTAYFKTVIALVLEGKEYVFDGVISGVITNEKRGQNGFGYDPIFIPDGYTQTFAEMDSQLKTKISHRGIAVQKLVDFLKSL